MFFLGNLVALPISTNFSIFPWLILYFPVCISNLLPHELLCFDIGWVLEQDRRQIERDFFSGKLSGIAATNALELGIDVGHIDATLHLGFPGSFAR